MNLVTFSVTALSRDLSRASVFSYFVLWNDRKLLYIVHVVKGWWWRRFHEWCTVFPIPPNNKVVEATCVIKRLNSVLVQSKEPHPVHHAKHAESVLVKKRFDWFNPTGSIWNCDVSSRMMSLSATSYRMELRTQECWRLTQFLFYNLV
jgi:hypothetical protein